MRRSRQYKFYFQCLKHSASTVVIDLYRSLDCLIEVHNRFVGWKQDIGDDAGLEADRLLREYGKTGEGLDLLYALGEASMFSLGGTFFVRDWEESDDWSQTYERSDCDFALSTGVAIMRCHEFINGRATPPSREWFSAMGAKGASIRHLPMATLKGWAVARYRSGSWKSANAAAHSLVDEVLAHGRTIGAHLAPENAQRTIAEWFRKSV